MTELKVHLKLAVIGGLLMIPTAILVLLSMRWEELLFWATWFSLLANIFFVGSIATYEPIKPRN